MVLIQRETQAIGDLLDRTIQIRKAIQVANQANVIKVKDTSRSIADWLCWRREVAPGMKQHLEAVQKILNDLRQKAQQKGWTVNAIEPKPQDLIVNVNEAALASELETMEEILGLLDGQLSLKNATIVVE